MDCNQIRERMPDLAAGLGEITAEENKHLASCDACAGKLQEFRQTMALLDEWRAPEPSPYFDVRLQARLREEMARPQAEWMRWFRLPVLAAALTLLMGIGLGLFFVRGGRIYHSMGNDTVAEMESQQFQPGTAVSDLQALELNHDLYADFEILDDLQVQSDVTANP
jgi:predicted anti-sigma-YlaC factor YlaD